MVSPAGIVLHIPVNALVVLCGPAACGKSTFAARHFSATQIVSSDACRAILCDDAHNQKVSGRAFELFHFIIRHRLELNRLTVADSTALERSARRDLQQLARECGRPAAIIVFNVPLETCLKRNRQRARVVEPEVIAAHYAKLQVALPSIPAEGFDWVYLLDEVTMDSVRIALEESRGMPCSSV